MKEERTKRYNIPLIEEKEEEVIEEEVIEEEKTHSLAKKIVLLILLLLISIFSYSKTIGNKIIDIKEYKIESTQLPDSWHGLKIIHFSDIHYGTSVDKKQLTKIIKKINEYNPDIIFFTGDLIEENISIKEDTKKEIIEELNKLNPTLYKYAIYGNADLNNKDYKEIMESSNFILLENEAKLLFYNNEIPVEIIGFSPIKTNPNYTILTNFIEEQDTTNYYKIVLLHEPDSLTNLLDYNPNLLLAGHTLGGIIKPFNQPLLLESGAKEYVKDTYEINNTKIFISSGLGTTKYNFRLFNHPSINLYRIYTH